MILVTCLSIVHVSKKQVVYWKQTGDIFHRNESGKMAKLSKPES